MFKQENEAINIADTLKVEYEKDLFRLQNIQKDTFIITVINRVTDKYWIYLGGIILFIITGLIQVSRSDEKKNQLKNTGT